MDEGQHTLRMAEHKNEGGIVPDGTTEQLPSPGLPASGILLRETNELLLGFCSAFLVDALNSGAAGTTLPSTASTASMVPCLINPRKLLPAYLENTGDTSCTFRDCH